MSRMTAEAIELRAALAAIGMCADVLYLHRDLLRRFIAESRHMDSVGPILDPTLWMNPERQKTDAAIRPLAEQTLSWLAAVDRAKAAIAGASSDMLPKTQPITPETTR